MGVHKKVNGLGEFDVTGTITLYDGEEAKRTAKFTRRAQLRSIRRKWSEDVKKLKGNYYFIIALKDRT